MRQADLRKNSVWGERKTSTKAGVRNSQEAKVVAVEGRARGQGWGEVQGVTGPDQAKPGGLQKDAGLYSKEGRIILTLGLTGSLTRCVEMGVGHWKREMPPRSWISSEGAI